MPVLSTEKDLDALTLTLTAEFDAPVDRVWQIWEDPRQLERWWGPPTYPATFERHELAPGSSSAYYMTGPNGEKSRGWWRIVAVDRPTRVEFEDGFADEAGDPVDAIGITRAVVTLSEDGSRTRMTMVSTFESAEQLQQMIEMGMQEGLRLAAGQIDDLLVSQQA